MWGTRASLACSARTQGTQDSELPRLIVGKFLLLNGSPGLYNVSASWIFPRQYKNSSYRHIFHSAPSIARRHASRLSLQKPRFMDEELRLAETGHRVMVPLNMGAKF